MSHPEDDDRAEHWLACLMIDTEGRVLVDTNGHLPTVLCNADARLLDHVQSATGIDTTELRDSHILYWRDAGSGCCVDVYAARVPVGLAVSDGWTFLELGTRLLAACQATSTSETAFWLQIATAIAAEYVSEQARATE